jgi:rhamnulokinase
MAVVAAVDCGATSVRVCRIDLDATTLTPRVVHRVAHVPRRDPAGHLRWDWDRITSAVIDGLERAVALGPLASIGIDTWAVDYGLVDEHGALLSEPYSYRDHRTDGYRSIVDRFGPEAMYRVNGLQLEPFNTVFQLAFHDRDELARAARLLWLPELILHHLTGVAITERTSAGCSGLVDLPTGDWSTDMLDLAGIPRDLLGSIEHAARVVGDWRGVPVSLVAGHDTASAVVGMGPAAPGGSAFVSTGTWMLPGVERAEPDTSEWARLHNFTNEAAALGGIRFLRNVTGFWLLERCREAWGGPDVADLVAAAERVGPHVPVVDVDDGSLRAPDDMLDAYTSLAGIPRDTDAGLVTRSIVESIAARTASVLRELREAVPFDDVVMFGGATRIEMFRHRLAALTSIDVRAGSAEAAAIGNAIVQGIAIGRFSSIDDGRVRIPVTTDRPAENDLSE